MSNDEAPYGDEAEIISPEDGVADGEPAGLEAPDEPQYDYLDIDDDLASKYVNVKIDGEDTPVQLSELTSGYSREAVSTQRFQKASEMQREAEQALRLQQALQVNPGLTVQFLAQQAGVSVQQFLGMSESQREAATEANQEDQYLDPLERQLMEERQARLALEERFAQREADERLGMAVGQLKAQFSINDDQARAVVGQALQMGVGPEMFPVIYQAMAYQATQQAQAQHTAEQAAEVQRRQAAAQRAAAVVGNGSSAVGLTQDTGQGQFTSIREAALAAYEEVVERGQR